MTDPLAAEQAALRRVATLVAQGASTTEVCAAVAREVTRVVPLLNAIVSRFDNDGDAVTIVAVCDDFPHAFQPGTRWPLDGPSLATEVLRTRRPARIEDYAGLPGSIAAEVRRSGATRAVGAPIIVDGRVWGVITASSPEAPFADGVEERLTSFTELIAAAVANSQAREELTQVAAEQAALRRVATLVADGAPSPELFAAVCAEVARVVPAEAAVLSRDEEDGTVMVLGGWTGGAYAYAGQRFATEGTVSGLVLQTGRPARLESFDGQPGKAAAAARAMGWSSSVGAPITVQGRLWGVLAVVATAERSLPPDAERRLVEFTELVATAIANAESREQATRLADEQAALRRVATLVAGSPAPEQVFAAVSAEVGRLIPGHAASVSRYEPDGTMEVVGAWVDEAWRSRIPVGLRCPIAEAPMARRVFETGRAARTDDPDGGLPAVAGMGSVVAAPISVGGRLWGVVHVGTTGDSTLPVDTEERLAGFTELAATAISNAEGRAELEVSRARIVATADATRRRIERDLHDGAQQELLSLALELRAAQAAVPPELAERRAHLSRIVEGLTSALDDLREIALGLHPSILAEGGLGPALNTLGRRSPLPVEAEVNVDRRLPEAVEVAAYYVVSEALTNAATHARSARVRVQAHLSQDVLRVVVSDDGPGGADPERGSGLLGLRDRVEAIGGTFVVESRPGMGTVVTARLPAGHDSR